MAIALSEKQIKEGWQIVKFGEIAKNISKRVEPGETDLEVYVGLEHIDPQSLRITRRGVPADVKGQKLRVCPGQVIFGKRRAYQKKVAVADFDGICSAHAMVLEEVIGKITPGLLPFFMQSDMFMDRAVAISEGSLSPTIKWKTLAVQEFPLPPVERQKEIIKIMYKIEDSKVRLEQARNSCENIFRTLSLRLFKDVLSDGMEKPFGNIIIQGPQNGLYKSSKYYGNGVPIMHMNDLFKRSIIKEVADCKRLSLNNNEFEKYKLKKGDLLFSRTSLVRKGAGNCFIYDVSNGSAIFESNIIRVRLDEKMCNPDFYYYFFNSAIGRWHINRLIGTLAASSITGGDLKKMKVPITSKENQNMIVEKMSVLNCNVDRFNENISRLNSMFRSAINSIW